MCYYAFTTGRHSADVIHVMNGVKWCCLYCRTVSASFISLYSFSTSICQDRLITDMCDNSRKLAICGGKKLSIIMLYNVKGFWWWYIKNCDQNFGHCPSYMAKNPIGWICLHLQMKWGGENLLLLHVTQRWSQSLHTKQNLDNVHKLSMSHITSER